MDDLDGQHVWSFKYRYINITLVIHIYIIYTLLWNCLSCKYIIYMMCRSGSGLTTTAECMSLKTQVLIYPLNSINLNFNIITNLKLIVFYYRGLRQRTWTPTRRLHHGLPRQPKPELRNYNWSNDSNQYFIEIYYWKLFIWLWRTVKTWAGDWGFEKVFAIIGGRGDRRRCDGGDGDDSRGRGGGRTTIRFLCQYDGKRRRKWCERRHVVCVRHHEAVKRLSAGLLGRIIVPQLLQPHHHHLYDCQLTLWHLRVRWLISWRLLLIIFCGAVFIKV